MKQFTWRWSEKQHNLWRQKRVKGLRRFVVVDGMLSWGLPMYIAMAAGPVVLGSRRVGPQYWLWQLMLWAVAGVLFGFLTWYLSERQFRKHEGRAL